ncbi:lactosylceramide 4-alpha-galactosyltransferase-like [Protopterus annectens]|uniref:lactosylceramide 4-alpha-galactosyltransferase-like n=1 Tax=Protopterus annectens TaxID=7888 RepID=UPI001CFAD647|nr:lactosylceramide 4-alpha-galactosyltransferase-like [Protopterus annectens]
MSDRSKLLETGIFQGVIRKSSCITVRNVIGVCLISIYITYVLIQVETQSDTSLKQPSPKPAKRNENYSYIIFVQTTDSGLPSLVVCAIESAAIIYKRRKVRFYMKGTNDENPKRSDPGLELLKTISNVEILKLDPESVLENTPLEKWYKNTDPTKERYWTHVQSDAFRYALLWQNGGMYMDTDVISIKALPEGNFLGFQSSGTLNGAVLSFSTRSSLLYACMTDFVQNYQGSVWGHQGPGLLTRVFQRLCNVSMMDSETDHKCTSQNITFMKRSAFYHIPYPEWKRFYSTSDNPSVFQDFYAVHVWNQMNQWNGKKTIKAQDETLLEKLFKEYCPQTHSKLL